MTSKFPLIDLKFYINNKNHSLFFYIIFYIILTPINLLHYFSPYTLFSGNILLLSEDGLKIYEPNSNNINSILNFTSYIDYEGGQSTLSFTQFSSLFNDYSICSLQGNLLFLQNGNFSCIKVSSEFNYNYKILVPYNTKENYTSFILGLMNNNNLILRMYNLFINETCEINLMFENTFKYNNTTSQYYGSYISCELMYYKGNHQNYTLICFTEISNPYNLIANIINITNNFEIVDYLLYPEANPGIGAIKSILSEDKKSSLVCYTLINFNSECVIYNSEENKWGTAIKIYDSCSYRDYLIGLLFLDDIREYAFYCHSNNYVINIFLFDKYFNLKNLDNNKQNFANFTFYLNYLWHVYSSSVVYLPNMHRFLILYSNKNESTDFFNKIEIGFDNSSKRLCLGICHTESYNISENATETEEILIDSTFQIDSINTIKESINENHEKIDFFNDNTIMKAKVNKTKEEMINNLDDILDQIDVGTKYRINGKDYEIIISPANKMKSFNSTYVDLGECVDILREKYNLSSDEVVSILQVEIDALNEQVIANQIEYIVFDEEKNKLDLSFCQDLQITVNYKIKNSSLIDKDKIKFYSDMNIDIFNHSDPFFNDICYSYSQDKKDIVLKDRVKDIYQNYSFCEDKCEYKKMNKELSTVTCECDVKTELNIKTKMPVFYKIMENSFKDSNFEVIKCFKLAFKFSNKVHNAGFWISIIIFALHIPLYIIYFIFKIKKIKKFVYDEMRKKNYIFEIKFPPKRLQNSNDEEDIYSINNDKSEEAKLKLSNRTRNKIKFDKENKLKSIKRKTIKSKTNNALRNTINFNFFNQGKDNIRKENKHLTKSFRKNVRFSSIFRRDKKLEPEKEKYSFKPKKIVIKDEKNHSKNYSSNNILKIQKGRKTVKFNIYEDQNPFSNKYDTPKNKILKDDSSMINIYQSRRSQKNLLISTPQIVKKLLGNEEKEKIPGFYNLIHINANNDSRNRPLDSKYILDNYVYETAILYDHRDFWRIYFICILAKENIINTFFFKSPLELQSIRLCLFLFNYSCDFALNAFFYLNENISDRYHYKGENLFFYSIINNLTISLSCAIFSFLLSNLLSYLTNSKDDIVFLFRREEEKMRKNKKYKVSNSIKNKILIKLKIIFKMLKIKIIFFIIAETLILLFFAYYMVVFCEIYKETQMSWLADSGMSFLISIPLELLSSFVMALFYYISIRFDLKFIYNIVMFFYQQG